jgi:DNA end-binding protein Ku
LGYKVAPEQFVVVEKEEIRRLRLPTSSTMEILRTVHLDEIDPVYFETSYYVVPDKGGDRAYALLFQALRQTEYVAVSHVAMHGREHILIVRPGRKGLLAHTMYYQDEVRANSEYETNTSDVTRKEVDLATKFVEAIAGPFAPEEFKDTYREELQKIISGKQKREEIALTNPTVSATTGAVVDIMDALRKSLERVRNQTDKQVARKPARAASRMIKRHKRKA